MVHSARTFNWKRPSLVRAEHHEPTHKHPPTTGAKCIMLIDTQPTATSTQGIFSTYMYMGIRSLQHTKLAEEKNPSKVNVFRGCHFQSALPLGPRWAGGSLESHSDVFVCPRDQWLLPPPIVQQRLSDRQDPPQGGQWKVLSTTTTRVSSILTIGLPREQFGWDLLRVGPATHHMYHIHCDPS